MEVSRQLLPVVLTLTLTPILILILTLILTLILILIITFTLTLEPYTIPSLYSLAGASCVTTLIRPFARIGPVFRG